MNATYDLSVTTQGPSYPPSEVMNVDGDFVVIGRVNESSVDGGVRSTWRRAIVSARSPVPAFGSNVPYEIVRWLPDRLDEVDRAMVLHTLPVPLPCNNYPMTFAPVQRPHAATERRPSYPFHLVPIPDLRLEDGRRRNDPVTLGQWVEATGQLRVGTDASGRTATFELEMSGLIPDSLYTVMSLRSRDLDQAAPTRPGPLGVPNVFVSDERGRGRYKVTLPNPFPDACLGGANRIVNVIVLWMSYQMNYGGAIGLYGLGGDIHAQLKLQDPGFEQFTTKSN